MNEHSLVDMRYVTVGYVRTAAWDRDVASVEISRLCWTVRGDYGSQVFSECMVSTNTPRLVAAKRVTLVIKSSS